MISPVSREYPKSPPLKTEKQLYHKNIAINRLMELKQRLILNREKSRQALNNVRRKQLEQEFINRSRLS